jgi:hypothetical protein
VAGLWRGLPIGSTTQVGTLGEISGTQPAAAAASSPTIACFGNLRRKVSVTSRSLASSVSVTGSMPPAPSFQTALALPRAASTRRIAAPHSSASAAATSASSTYGESARTAATQRRRSRRCLRTYMMAAAAAAAPAVAASAARMVWRGRRRRRATTTTTPTSAV